MTTSVDILRTHIKRETLPAKHEVLSEPVLHDLIIELFERSQKGEYLAQYTSGRTLYTQEIAGLLDISPRRLLEAVEELQKAKRIGLYGMILVPYEEQEATMTTRRTPSALLKKVLTEPVVLFRKEG